MRINEKILRKIIRESLKEALLTKDEINSMDREDYRNTFNRGSENYIWHPLSTDDDKDTQERLMYGYYGNKSQYPQDEWWDYQNDNGEISMNALTYDYDPDYVDEFDPEMTSVQGQDPYFWRSKKPGYSGIDCEYKHFM